MSKILLVDDDLDILEVLRHALIHAGFEVLTAADAEEFRQQTREEKPDVIILDIMLGDQDGPEIYQKLLDNGFDRNIPVVFLSSLAQDCSLIHPQRGRTYALLSKPCDHRELVEELRCLVQAAKPTGGND